MSGDKENKEKAETTLPATVPQQKHQGLVSIMDGAMPVEALIQQVQLIQKVMSKVMTEGEHYGRIPGCGDKPALLKAGAEKLGFVFRMRPEFKIDIKDLERGHREYNITCTLYQIGSDIKLGEGVGSASTMETKWRFRMGPKEFTGRLVPQDYWTLRKADPDGAQRLIGGKGYGVSKNPEAGNRWEVVMAGERVEHDNPADMYNTALKMGKKRAAIDAILTCTAASDCFTQDIDDEDFLSGDILPPDEDGEQKPKKETWEDAATPEKKAVLLRQHIIDLAASKKVGISKLNKSIGNAFPGKNLDTCDYEQLLGVKENLERFNPNGSAQPEEKKE